MLFIILGLVSGLTGFFLIRGSKKSDTKSLNIYSVDETNVRNLLENYESLSNAYGKNSFNLYVKLYGDSYTKQPLIAEYSKKECVYYSIKVEREYEELVTRTDSNKKITKNWVRKSETILDKEYYSEDFCLKDSDGIIKISQNGADIDPVQSYSNFETSTSRDGGVADFNFAGISIRSSPSNKTIGFKYLEKMIPVGRRLFVVGNASDSNGELIILKPSEKHKPFMVSLKSESEIMSSLANASKIKKGWGYGLLIVGIGLLIFGILKKIEVL